MKQERTLSYVKNTIIIIIITFTAQQTLLIFICFHLVSYNCEIHKATKCTFCTRFFFLRSFSIIFAVFTFFRLHVYYFLFCTILNASDLVPIRCNIIIFRSSKAQFFLFFFFFSSFYLNTFALI